MKRSRSVDEYIATAEQWQGELQRLREILQSNALTEEVKWGAPCYTWKGKNVVGIGGFKSYFGLWFHQGALLGDDAGVLINAQEGKTKALRQWRMSTARDIKPTIIRRYVKESITNIDAGREIRASRDKSIVVPDELAKAMRRHKGATAAFRKLRPGLQREYAGYVSEAKRDDTKQKRIAKILPMIVAGKGLNDRYC
jgi:uncharacterized protein YdeI (YjbR/CyaY-like superfamily)